MTSKFRDLMKYSTFLSSSRFVERFSLLTVLDIIVGIGRAIFDSKGKALLHLMELFTTLKCRYPNRLRVNGSSWPTAGICGID